MPSNHVMTKMFTPEERNKPSARLIMVDDDQRLLELYWKVLGKSGNYFDSSQVFDVDLHSRGDEAIESVRNAVRNDVPFAVAFLDIVLMEGPDGYETAARMRELDPLLEIVFVTGHPDAGKLEAARSLHPKEKLLYIQKPFSVLELRQLAIALSAKWNAEKRLRKTQTQLEQMSRQVMETNQALSILAQNIQKAKEESDVRLSLGIRSKVLAHPQGYPGENADQDDAVVELDMLENYMRELTSNFEDGANIASSLTPSELRIACMIKNGLTNPQIADQMFISVGTVKTHRKHIRNKLEIRNSNQNLRAFLKKHMTEDR